MKNLLKHLLIGGNLGGWKFASYLMAALIAVALYEPLNPDYGLIDAPEFLLVPAALGLLSFASLVATIWNAIENE